jgi:hypothetical protein
MDLFATHDCTQHFHDGVQPALDLPVTVQGKSGRVGTL